MNICTFAMMVISVGLAGQNPGNSPQQTRYDVEQVLAVRSMSQFECRLKDYPNAENVRFRVQIRDITPNPQISKAQRTEFVKQSLQNGKTISLTNIQFRNYFRMTADVMVDGINLADELCSQQYALAVVSEEIPEKTPATSRLQTNQIPRNVSRMPTAAVVSDIRPKTQYVSLDSLMDATVNLSEINDETTFAEALDILSDSVRPRLPLVILWNDLENNALVDKDMPIGIGGFGNIQIRRALKLILSSVSQDGMDLELAVEGRVVTIGTQRGLLRKSVLRTYSVKDITSASFNEYGGLNYSKMNDLMRIFQPSSSQ